MNEHRFEQLLAKHLDGELSAAEEREFQQLLASSEEARVSFCEQGMLDGRLRWEHGGTSAAKLGMPSKQKFLVKNLWLAGALGALAIVGLIIYGSLNHRKSGNNLATGDEPEIDPITDPFVATLALARGCEWASSSPPPEGGAMLPGGYELVRGKANIVMDSGASVLVEAPARFHLIGANRLLLKEGELAARMADLATEPFIVDTPNAMAIDRGTEFTVGVDENQQTEILIQDGAVEIHEQESGRRSGKRLTADSGFRTSHAGQGKTFKKTSSSRFGLVHDWADTGRGYWHWSFDESEGTLVIEDGSGISDQRFDGRLRSKQVDKHLPDRLAGKFGGALAFNGGPGRSIVRTSCPGIAGARPRSVAFWVRIPRDAKDSEAQSMVSWGAREASGARWHLEWNQSSQPGATGAIRTDVNGGYVVGSTDLRDGEWHHVVGVFTGGLGADVASSVKHYVDGKLEAVSASRKQFVATAIWGGVSDRHVPELPVRFGMRAAAFSERAQFFRGDLDEVYIFNTALSLDEIGDLMENRRPEIENQDN